MGTVWDSEVLAVVHVMLLQLAVELILAPSVSGGTSAVEASDVEALSALEVVKVAAEEVLVSEVCEVVASEEVEAVEDSGKTLVLEREVVSEADVTAVLLLVGCGQTPPLL